MNDFLLAPYYWIRGWFIYATCEPGTLLYNTKNYKYYRIVSKNVIVRQGSTIFISLSNLTTGKFYQAIKL